MASKSASQHRQVYQDISGSYTVDATDTEVTVVSSFHALETIFIQTITVDIASAGAASTTWEATDGNGTLITSDFPADTEGSTTRDFGAQGRPLKEGEGLVLAFDAGATGIVSWEGYRKLTGVGAA